jgi:hypothetical protein
MRQTTLFPFTTVSAIVNTPTTATLASKGQNSFSQLDQALQSCENTSDCFVTVAAISTNQSDQSGNSFSSYLVAVRKAAELAPPPFCLTKYVAEYERMSTNPRWLAISIIANAQREGQGATDLWSLAACAEDPAVMELIKKHAVDESRHAKLYLSLLDLVFPDVVEEGFRKELNSVSPGFTLQQPLFSLPNSDYARNPSIDDLVQMNIAEIRTTLHHLMQRKAVFRHAPLENQQSINKILDSLLVDELNHVGYTAELIESKSSDIGEAKLNQLYECRLRDFNQITIDEFRDGTFLPIS